MSTSIDNRYHILKKLGMGGMGAVFLVHDTSRQTQLALKMLSRKLHKKEDIDRFKAEFQATAFLNHTNIIRAYDFGITDEDKPYFTMEHIDGAPLSDIAKKSNISVLNNWMMTLCLALNFIHEKGLIHYDIKPSNIMIEKGGRLILMDFGLVESVNAPGDREVKGTLGFLAPEVMLGETVDARADLYSFGVTWYRVLTGRAPFKGDSLAQIIYQQLENNFTPPSEINPDIDLKLDSIISQLLSRDPNERFQSAEEVHETYQMRFGDRDSVRLKEYAKGYITSAGFTARQEIFATIRELAQKAGTSPQVIFIQGDLGAGKSRLVRQVEVDLQLQGIDCYRGYSSQAAASAYSCFHNPLRLLVSSTKADTLRRKYHEVLSIVLPEMNTSNDTANVLALGSREKVEWLQSELAAFLGEAAQQELTTIILDDFHQADRHSVQLFSRLLEHIESYSKSFPHLLILVTTESGARLPGGDSDEFLDAKISAWAQNYDFISRFELSNFRENQIQYFVTGMLGKLAGLDHLVSKLMLETEGNPLYIEEIMKNLVEDRILYRQRAQWFLKVEDLQELQLPSSLLEAIERRINSLDLASQGLLQMASIVNQEWTIKLLAELSDKPEGEVLRCLNLLKAGRYITEINEQGRHAFNFTHQKLRDVLYKRYSMAQLTKLHHRVGKFLEQSPDIIVGDREKLLTHHFLLGEQYEKAADYAKVVAGRYKALYALEEAVEFYEKAVYCLEKVGCDSALEESMELLNIQGALFFSLGDMERALANCEKIWKRANALRNISYEARSLGNMGFIYDKLGKKDEAIQKYQQVLSLTHQIDNPQLKAGTLTNLGFLFMAKGELTPAREYLLAALELAEEMQDDNLLCYNCLNLGYIVGLLGDVEKRSAYFEQGNELAKKLNNKDMIAKFQNEIGITQRQLGNLEQSYALLTSALEEARKSKAAQKIALSLNHLAGTALVMGRLVEAEKLLEESRTITSETGIQREHCEALCFSAHLHFLSADFQRALMDIDQAYQIAVNLEDKEMEVEAVSIMTLIDPYCLAEETPVAELEELLAFIEQQEYHAYKARTLLALARCALRSGDLDEVFEYLDSVEKVTGQSHDVLDRMDFFILKAEYELVRQSPDKARDSAGSALELALKYGSIPNLLKSRLLIAESLLTQPVVSTDTTIIKESEQHLVDVLNLSCAYGLEEMKLRLLRAQITYQMEIEDYEQALLTLQELDESMSAILACFTSESLKERFLKYEMIADIEKLREVLYLKTDQLTYSGWEAIEEVDYQTQVRPPDETSWTDPPSFTELMNDEISRELLQLGQLYSRQKEKPMANNDPLEIDLKPVEEVQLFDDISNEDDILPTYNFYALGPTNSKNRILFVRSNNALYFDFYKNLDAKEWDFVKGYLTAGIYKNDDRLNCALTNLKSHWERLHAKENICMLAITKISFGEILITSIGKSLQLHEVQLREGHYVMKACASNLIIDDLEGRINYSFYLAAERTYLLQQEDTIQISADIVAKEDWDQLFKRLPLASDDQEPAFSAKYIYNKDWGLVIRT